MRALLPLSILLLLLPNHGDCHVQIVDDFLTDEAELEALRKVPVNLTLMEHETSLYSHNYGTGFANVSKAFVNRVLSTQHAFDSHELDNATSCMNEDLVMDTTTILTSCIYTGETQVHQDRLWDPERTIVDDPIGFIFLNDNEDASFVLYSGDDRNRIIDSPTARVETEKITVVPQKGRLLVFDGRVPHHTIVNSGMVHLAGPFRMVPTMDFVGKAGPPPTKKGKGKGKKGGRK